MRRGKHPRPRFADERLAFGWIRVTMLGFPYAPKEAVPWQRTGRATRVARRRSRRAWRRPARARWARLVARRRRRAVAAMVPIRARSARACRRLFRALVRAPRAPAVPSLGDRLESTMKRGGMQPGQSNARTTTCCGRGRHLRGEVALRRDPRPRRAPGPGGAGPSGRAGRRTPRGSARRIGGTGRPRSATTP